LLTASVASSLRLRPAEVGDADWLADLRNRLAEHFLSSAPATAEKTVQLLDDSHTYVLEVDGRRVGSWALYRQRGDRMEFGRFMLEPRERRNGVGRLMLEYAIAQARELGVRRLQLVAKPLSVAAHELYGEVGFVPTQVRMELVLD